MDVAFELFGPLRREVVCETVVFWADPIGSLVSGQQKQRNYILGVAGDP
jgi:hypothetical protein